MSKPRYFYNATCIECDAIEKIMVRIGTIVMCQSCHGKIFKTEDPVMEERPKYLHYLEKTTKKAMEEE